MASHVDVVVLDENEFVGEPRIAHHFGNLLQHPLAGLVARMRLARKHELHRPCRVVDDLSEPLDIRQNQVRSFVRGETPREADRQSILA